MSSSSVKVVVASDSSPESCECVRVCTTSSPLDPGGWTAPEVTPSGSATGNKALEGVGVTVRSLAVARSTGFASRGCGWVSDRGMDCGETTVDEVEGSLVWWEDCAGSAARPFWTWDEDSPTVPTDACFSLRAGTVIVGWASPGSSTSCVRVEGTTHGMKTRTSLLRKDSLVWDFGGFSCLAGEAAVASEADRAPSEEDL